MDTRVATFDNLAPGQEEVLAEIHLAANNMLPRLVSLIEVAIYSDDDVTALHLDAILQRIEWLIDTTRASTLTR